MFNFLLPTRPKLPTVEWLTDWLSADIYAYYSLDQLRASHDWHQRNNSPLVADILSKLIEEKFGVQVH